MEQLKKYLTPENVTALVAGIVLVIILCIPVGVANNGDFDRVIYSTGLDYLSEPDDRYFHYVDENYRFLFKSTGMVYAAEETQMADIRQFDWDTLLSNLYITTHMIPIWLTVLLSALVAKSYSIWWLSVFYGAMFILALYLGVSGIGRRYGTRTGWFAAAFAIFIFCDLGYLSYFNSFYGEASSYVFLLLAAGAFVALLSQQRPQLWHMVVYFIGTIMFVGSKQQNVLLVVFFLGLSIRLFLLYRDRLWRWVNVALSLIMVLVSASTMISMSDEIYEINIHQAVFIGILELGDNPASDLKELGLNEDLQVLAGHTYYENDVPYPPDSDYMRTEFFNKISYGSIVRFYLGHPQRLWAAMERTAQNGYQVMQSYLGNYTKDAGRAPGARASGFALYDNWRKWICTSNFSPLIFTILFYLLAAFFILRKHFCDTDPKTRALMEFLMILLVIGGVQFAMPYIADGRGDLSKHLFLFNMATDMIFFSGVTAAGSKIIRKTMDKKRPFSI